MAERTTPSDLAAWELDGSLHEAEGLRLFLADNDRLQHRLINQGMHEPAETALMGSVVQRGWTCLDIGANIGWHSLLLGRRVGPEGCVHAFEPMPISRTRLLRNIELNNANNIVVSPLALSSKAEVSHHAMMAGVPVLEGRLNLGGWSMKDPVNGAAADTVEVHSTTLDRYVAEQGIKHVHFIKMDIEGYESRALQGAHAVISKNRPYIVMEATYDGDDRTRGNVEKQLNILMMAGYTICVIRKNPWPHIRSFPRPDFQTPFHVNLFCYHGPKCDAHP